MTPFVKRPCGGGLLRKDETAGTVDQPAFPAMFAAFKAACGFFRASALCTKSGNKKWSIDKCCAKRFGLFGPCRPSNDAK